MRSFAAALIAGLAASAAAAAPAPPAPTTPPKTVSPLTVVPADAPKLVSSFPAPGQAIAPGVLILKLVFDQKMLSDGFDIQAAPGAAAPDCLKTPRLLNDARTFVLLCTTAPKTRYAFAFNAASAGGFRNEGEIRAQPATLAFSTSDAEGPTDLAAAMKLEGLGSGDMPIENAPMTARAGPAGR